MNVPIPINMEDFCIVDDHVWFVHSMINALMRTDISNGQTEYVARPPVSFAAGFNSTFRKIIYHSETHSLLMVPNQHNYFLVYDINKNIFKKVNTITLSSHIPLHGFFKSAIVLTDVVLCVPTQYEKVLLLNMGDWNTVDSLPLDKWRLIDNKFYVRDYCRVNNKIALLIYPAGIIVIVSVYNNKLEIVEVVEHKNSIETIAAIGDVLYCRDIIDKRIISVNLASKEKRECFRDVEDDDYLLYDFSDRLIMKDYVYRNHITFLNKDMTVVEDYLFNNDLNEYEYAYCNSSEDKKYKGKTLYYNNKSEELLSFSELGTLKDYIRLELCNKKETLLDDLSVAFWKTKTMVKETPYMSVEHILR